MLYVRVVVHLGSLSIFGVKWFLFCNRIGITYPPMPPFAPYNFSLLCTFMIQMQMFGQKRFVIWRKREYFRRLWVVWCSESSSPRPTIHGHWLPSVPDTYVYIIIMNTLHHGIEPVNSVPIYSRHTMKITMKILLYFRSYCVWRWVTNTRAQNNRVTQTSTVYVKWIRFFRSREWVWGGQCEQYFTRHCMCNLHLLFWQEFYFNLHRWKQSTRREKSKRPTKTKAKKKKINHNKPSELNDEKSYICIVQPATSKLT